MVAPATGDIGDGRMTDGKTDSSPIADIAVVGMAVRLPGAGDVDAFLAALDDVQQPLVR